MARIAGVDLPREKRVEVGLTYIYGIGRSTSRKILAETGVDPNTKVRDLAEGEVGEIRSYLDQNVQVEGDLRREENQNIRRLIDIGTYRGIRHRRGLPVRGQRTKTNARQRKGPKPSIGGREKREMGRQRQQRRGASRSRRRVRRNIPTGVGHIKSSFNNTIISVTDTEGNVIAWESAGSLGFKGSRKSTPYAAQMTAESVANKAMDQGMRRVDIEVKGHGSGRDMAARTFQSVGIEVLSIKDVTGQPHNGCRPPKRRRG